MLTRLNVFLGAATAAFLPQFENAMNGKCPADMTAFRSDKVVNSFDPAMTDGLWYEHAFIDIAQVGASC